MKTPSTNNNLLGVLFLPSPPSNRSVRDWYWREIAGVPFLLRNIINIQRAGISRLILLIDKNHKDVEDFYQHIIQDVRISLKLQWLSSSQQLMQTTKGTKELLLLDGSSLYEKAKIVSAITQNSNLKNSEVYRSYFLSETSLNSILELIDNFKYSMLEKIQEQSIDSEPKTPDSEKQLRVYLPERGKATISKKTDFQVEGERIIKTSGGLKNDSFITRTLSRPISQRLTRLFLKTPFTPNQITILSFILGLGSAWCFFQGGYQMGLSGAGLLLLSIWIDGVDGEVARIKLMESKMGAKLDIFCDNVVHIAVFFSIGTGLFHINGQIIFLYLGLLAAFGSLISFLMLRATIIEDKSKANSMNKDQQNETDLIDKLTNRDFTHILFLLALINHLDIFIWMTAVGVNLLAVFLLFSKMKLNFSMANEYKQDL